MGTRGHFNQKREMDPEPQRDELERLAHHVRYVGHPHHKRSPGDFGLIPPAQPRLDKTLCDDAGITRKRDAQRLLLEGVRKGFVSPIPKDGYPKHIWVVTEQDTVLEARYSNAGPGHYHGYPLLRPDPFRDVVLHEWNRQ